MNRIRRLAAVLAGLAGALLAFAAVAPAAFADRSRPVRPAGTSTRRRSVPGSTPLSRAACPAGRSP